MQLKKLKIDNLDLMYVCGSVLVVLGVAMRNTASGFIAGGVFLLLAPILNLVQGFMRGIKQ
jgi:hypothetical protein